MHKSCNRVKNTQFGPYVIDVDIIHAAHICSQFESCFAFEYTHEPTLTNDGVVDIWKCKRKYYQTYAIDVYKLRALYVKVMQRATSEIAFVILNYRGTENYFRKITSLSHQFRCILILHSYKRHVQKKVPGTRNVIMLYPVRAWASAAGKL